MEIALICFTIGEVVILGIGLHPLAKAVQKTHLQSVARINRNYPTDSPESIYSVVVTIHKTGNQQ